MCAILLSCATRPATSEPTTPQREPASQLAATAACTPPERAKRIWIGFEPRFSLEDFESAALRSEHIIALIRSSACALDVHRDPAHALRHALEQGRLELHSVIFTRADLSRAEARLRPLDGDPQASSFRLELEEHAASEAGAVDRGAAVFQVVRALAVPDAGAP